MFGTSGTFASPSRYVCIVMIPSIMEKISVRIPIIENGKNVKIVIAGKQFCDVPNRPVPSSQAAPVKGSEPKASIATPAGLPSCSTSPTPCTPERIAARIPKSNEIAYNAFIVSVMVRVTYRGIEKITSVL